MICFSLSRSPRGKPGWGRGAPTPPKPCGSPRQEGFQNALLNPPYDPPNGKPAP